MQRNVGLVYGAVLLFFSGADRRHAWSLDWPALGAAQAGLIRDGAWWRAATGQDQPHVRATSRKGGDGLHRLLGVGLPRRKRSIKQVSDLHR